MDRARPPNAIIIRRAMAVVQFHQHVAGREHEDDHRHEHEDDGLRLSVVAERLIEALNCTFLLLLLRSLHQNKLLIAFVVPCNFDGKDAFLFDADRDRRDITEEDLAASF